MIIRLETQAAMYPLQIKFFMQLPFYTQLHSLKFNSNLVKLITTKMNDKGMYMDWITVLVRSFRSNL